QGFNFVGEQPEITRMHPEPIGRINLATKKVNWKKEGF
ncbi:unnamed protein product, partial [marine sediment metagenome]